MSPVSALPAIVALATALLAAFALVKVFGEPPEQGRFASIDGLRGLLAFFVFLHHSCIWFYYLRSGKWQVPPSNLYTHFGQSAVATFFMITGFLFFSKLIDGRSRRIDWGRLYVARILRLVPLYFFVVALMVFLVIILRNGVLREPLPKLAAGVARWLSFTVLGAPNLNGVDHTPTIVAGVTWSLPYEWLFYFVLPVLALGVGVKPPPAYIGFGLLAVAFAMMHPSAHYLSFFGGIAAAFVARIERARKFAAGNVSSVVAIFCLILMVGLFPSGYNIASLLLLSISFILIAAGNSLFGILTSATSRMLGEFSYGIYLLHGVVLFVTFNFVVGLSAARALSATQHWAIVVGVSPVLVLACFLANRLIELPAMRRSTKTTNWLRSFIPDRFRVLQ